jgi:hypothetical protein
MFKRKHARILKHHRNSAVYIDGRYLHVDMKISMKSKRGREIARETAGEILSAVGLSEAARNLTAHRQAGSEAQLLEDGLKAVVTAEAER